MTYSTPFEFSRNQSNSAISRAAVYPLPRAVPISVPVHLPTVRSTLGALRSRVPAFSAMLGTCEDGLPFLLDLQDPTAGSVLVTGDPGSGKTRLLQSIVDSIVMLNTSREVQYALITSYPEEWNSLVRQHFDTGHCRGVFAGSDPAAQRLVLELSALAEARWNGAVSGPLVVLVIDDLGPLLETDYEVQVNLHWLISGGPQCGIWPVVASSTHQALNLQYWIDLFRTRLLGKISAPAAGQRLGIRPGSTAHLQYGGIQFSAWLDGHWMNFWAADPGI